MSLYSHANTVAEDHTRWQTVRFTLKWNIENFRAFRNETRRVFGTGITMAALGMEDNYQGRWRICVRPCFKQIKDNLEKEYIGVFLNLTDVNEESSSYTGDEEIILEFGMRVTTGNTTKSEILSFPSQRLHTFSRTTNIWGWETAVSHNKMFGSDRKVALLKDDCITISMDVVIYKDWDTVQIPKAVASSSSQRYQRFADRQSKWFDSQQQRKSSNFDFLLVSSDDKQFHTSRWILMAHSPVFAAMLKPSSKETKASRCEMADVDGETTEIMLDYMYGCQIGKIDHSNAEKVLIMADKYELMDLRQVCEELLVSNVAVNKAVHYLVLASQRGLESLKAAALQVIPRNMATVLKDGALEEAVQVDPCLMQTIMEHCSKKMRVIDEP